MRQRTINNTIKFSSKGLHSGKPVNMVLKPAAVNSGIVFTFGTKSAKVSADKILQTPLCTSLNLGDGVSIRTIEHLMAVLGVFMIDNLQVEVDMPEIPIFDGSAVKIFDAIDKVGLKKYPSFKKFYRLNKRVQVSLNDAYAILEPADTISYNYTLDYTHRGLPLQSFDFNFSRDNFRKQLVKSRTFGFLEDHPGLKKDNLSLGANKDNCLFIDSDGQTSNDLFFMNEFARHKVVDAIGDIYAEGRVIICRYRGYKSGHYLNNLLLRETFKTNSLSTVFSLSSTKDKSLLPTMALRTL